LSIDHAHLGFADSFASPLKAFTIAKRIIPY